MPQTLKEEVLQMVAALNDEEALSILKNEIEVLSHQSNHDAIDDLPAKERAELMQLINEPDEKDTISFDEYKRLTERWRTK